MKLLILGAGKMGTFFCDVLSFDHEVAIFDIDPKRLRFTYNARRFTKVEEIKDFEPELVINAATVKYTISAFNMVLPHIPDSCILSDIASVKTGLKNFYETCGHKYYVSTHPMFGPTFASLSNLSQENAIIISEGLCAIPGTFVERLVFQLTDISYECHSIGAVGGGDVVLDRSGISGSKSAYSAQAKSQG